MAFCTEDQIIPAHPGPVVNHADPGYAAALDVDIHRPGPGIDRVVQKLSNNGKRPVDHLAGRDFSGNILPEDLYPPGGELVTF